MKDKFLKNYLFLGILMLILGFSLLFISKSRLGADDYFTNSYEKLKDEIREVDRDYLQVIDKLDNPDLIQIDFDDIGGNYPFFVYNNDKLIYWSDNSMVPDIQKLGMDQKLAYYEKAGWKGIIKQWQIASVAGDTRLVVFIPLAYEPPLPNQYLVKTCNRSIFYSPDFEISANKIFNNIYYLENEQLFSISFGNNYKKTNKWAQVVSTILISISLLTILIFVFLKISALAENNKYRLGFALFMFTWVFVFGISKIISGFNLVENVFLFDSRIYASSWFLNNYYDLFLFCIFILSASIILSNWVYRYGFLKTIVTFNTIIKLTFGSVMVVLLYYTLTFQFLILRDIYDNSQISLDIFHSLALTGSRISGVFLFTINTISIYFLFSALLNILLIATSSSRYHLIMSVLTGSIIFSFIENDFPVFFLIGTLLVYISLLLWSGIYTYFLKPSYLSLLYFISILIISALISSYSIISLEKFQTIDDLFDYANQNLIEDDVFAEYLIDETVKKVNQDPFISNWMTSPFVSKDIISRKIRQVYLGRYLDKYSVQILLFNQQGESLDGSTSIDYETILNRFAVQQNETDFEGVYQVNRLRSDFFKRYLAFIDIRRYNTVVGHILLDLKQNRTFEQNVYPELLVDTRLFNTYRAQQVSYAVFSGKELIFEGGEISYSSDFDSNTLLREDIYSKGVSKNGYLHIAIRTNAGRTIVVSAKGHSGLEFLSNFSFLFLTLIVILGTGLLIITWLRLVKQTGAGFAARIQLYLNLAFIIPLILVSITTISLLNSTSESTIRNEFIQKGNALANTIRTNLDNYLVTPSLREDLTESLRNASAILNTDADLYNLSGGLIISTQPDIYDKGLISRYLDHGAYQQLVKTSGTNMISDNRVGKLIYNTTHVPVKTVDTGRIIGILSLPFFNYKKALEQQQINVLTNIMNIFSLLFILLLILSYFVSKNLVYPLNIITGKLNKMSFLGYNEPIEWDSQDEIGRLVREYNTMISNLEESRQALARNQRELAWREIARHVAHEIKNPLTPMKLTLQQLQRRLAGQDQLSSDEISKPVNTLLYQVDVLRDIAASFSAFAKMPIPEMKPFNLSDLVRKTVALHHNDCEILFNDTQNDIEVTGDKKLMGRIITNIVLNAQQAEGDKPVKVIVTVKEIGKNIQLSMADNGIGISKDIMDKIFLPGFSTKKTGSGIGLAVAKHGIEQSGGQLWVESEIGKGTTFYIEIPLANS